MVRALHAGVLCARWAERYAGPRAKTPAIRSATETEHHKDEQSLARLAVRHTNAGQGAWILDDGCARPGARDWRQHSHIRSRQHHLLSPAPLSPARSRVASLRWAARAGRACPDIHDA